jgi:hypothetical protein
MSFSIIFIVSMRHLWNACSSPALLRLTKIRFLARHGVKSDLVNTAGCYLTLCKTANGASGAPKIWISSPKSAFPASTLKISNPVDGAGTKMPPATTTGMGETTSTTCGEGHRTDDAAVATRVAALRDNYVSTTLSRFDRLRNRRDPDHHFRADVVGLPHEIPRIPKSERYDGGRAASVWRNASASNVGGMWFTAKFRLVSSFTTSMSCS